MSCATEGFSAITKVFAIETNLPEPYPSYTNIPAQNGVQAAISFDLTPAGPLTDAERQSWPDLGDADDKRTNSLAHLASSAITGPLFRLDSAGGRDVTMPAEPPRHRPQPPGKPNRRTRASGSPGPRGRRRCAS